MTNKKNFQEPEITIEQLSNTLASTLEELHRTNNELKIANEKLIATEKSKNELISNISHDLRSPMTAIKNAIEYMDSLDTYEPGEIKSLLQIMDRRMDTLEKLVNDFFILTTVEDDHIPFHFQPIPIDSFLEEFYYVREADDKYGERHLRLELTDNLSCIVNVDPLRLEQALDNLFTNAWKYSEAGSDIILKAEKQADHKVKIIVQDTGIGISQDKVQHIFERTYMVNQARTPGVVTGCGLGLSIVSQIVKRFGGEISCESEIGQGSIFTIVLSCEEKKREV